MGSQVLTWFCVTSETHGAANRGLRGIPKRERAACTQTRTHGKLSFEHRFPHQTARRTKMLENIRQCIQSQERHQGSTRPGTWTKDGPNGWRDSLNGIQECSGVPRSSERQPTVSGGVPILVTECWEDEALRSINKRPAGNEKTQRDQDMRSLPCRIHAQSRVEETHDDYCATISGTNPTDNPVPEPSNVCERNEQERSKGRQKATRREPR